MFTQEQLMQLNASMTKEITELKEGDKILLYLEGKHTKTIEFSEELRACSINGEAIPSKSVVGLWIGRKRKLPYISYICKSDVTDTQLIAQFYYDQFIVAKATPKEQPKEEIVGWGVATKIAGNDFYTLSSMFQPKDKQLCDDYFTMLQNCQAKNVIEYAKVKITKI